MAESDDLGDFFAEIQQIEEVVVPNDDDAAALETTEEAEAVPVAQRTEVVVSAPAVVSEVVFSKPAEISAHTVVTYDIGPSRTYDDPYAFSSSSATSSWNAYPTPSTAAIAPPPPPPPPAEAKLRTDKEFVRKAGGEVWVDETLKEWPDNDFRIFVGDLGKDVSTEMLAKAFQHYKSFAKAKVLRTKGENKARGYGFVSFLDPMDCAKAIREMNGKYLGARPMKIRKSTWDERDIKEVSKKEKKKRKMYESLGIEN